MTKPLVSVITPVYNCRDTVATALESAFTQSLPPERIEVIAVDDGSTDGSAELLDELALAHEQLTVLHQANSGGAGAPRNRGLDVATGEFVFFLDADDRLGPEALERMTAMARRNDTDIVLGKQIGVGGRKVPRVFDETVERTHVLEPGSTLFGRMSMAALQLFRRSLIEDAGLRFTEGVLAHEDQLFTAGAYLRARAISILADYDCYYWSAREDGTSSTQTGGAGAADVYAIISEAMEQAARFAEPGPVRDQLHRRYFNLEVFGRLLRLYPDAPEDERKITYTSCRELLELWLTPELMRDLVPLCRVLAHCVLHNLADEVDTLARFHRDNGSPRLHLEEGRSFQKYPFFRDAAVGVPDDCYEIEAPPTVQHNLAPPAWQDETLLISGTVVVLKTDEGTPDVHLIVENGEGVQHRIPCERDPSERTDEGMTTTYTAELRPISEGWPDGHWTVRVEVAIAGHERTIPVVKPKDMRVPFVIVTRPTDGARLIRALPVRGRGALVLALGGDLDAADLPEADASLTPQNRLRVRIGAPAVLGSGPAPAMNLVLRHPRDGGADIRAALEPADPAHLQADLSLVRARPGRWKAHFELEGVGEPIRVRLPKATGSLGPATVSRVPPRRVSVRLDEKWLTVSVTDPLRRRLRGLWPGRSKKSG
ncbi:glycosyltransferase [Actinomadura spongiicola]|uniref:Glycosyltransferase n=1 Tax=Actinomadura spongiicola TaxID=2303421 RepID=A0A372GL06_9ACTN|nr:glycosyltransferase [Actinomadura spongiicola]RFS86061.1 glycosyltransferase [Actinomadura spongiicola]